MRGKETEQYTIEPNLGPFFLILNNSLIAPVILCVTLLPRLVIGSIKLLHLWFYRLVEGLSPDSLITVGLCPPGCIKTFLKQPILLNLGWCSLVGICEHAPSKKSKGTCKDHPYYNDPETITFKYSFDHRWREGDRALPRWSYNLVIIWPRPVNKKQGI